MGKIGIDVGIIQFGKKPGSIFLSVQRNKSVLKQLPKFHHDKSRPYTDVHSKILFS